MHRPLFVTWFRYLVSLPGTEFSEHVIRDHMRLNTVDTMDSCRIRIGVLSWVPAGLMVNYQSTACWFLLQSFDSACAPFATDRPIRNVDAPSWHCVEFVFSDVASAAMPGRVTKVDSPNQLVCLFGGWLKRIAIVSASRFLDGVLRYLSVQRDRKSLGHDMLSHVINGLARHAQSSAIRMSVAPRPGAPVFNKVGAGRTLGDDPFRLRRSFQPLAERQSESPVRSSKGERSVVVAWALRLEFHKSSANQPDGRFL
jgi:hypothetical protein